VGWKPSLDFAFAIHQVSFAVDSAYLLRRTGERVTAFVIAPGSRVSSEFNHAAISALALLRPLLMACACPRSFSLIHVSRLAYSATTADV